MIRVIKMSEKIVYAYVVADLLHIGHVSFLETAKDFVGKEGKLIVGVLSDDAVMEKKSKPVLSFTERIKLVRALKCVDIVIPQNTYSPIENVKKINPHLLMESNSHTEEDLRKTRDITESIGCKVIVIPYYPNQSSTKIKNSVVESWNQNNGSYNKKE